MTRYLTNTENRLALRELLLSGPVFMVLVGLITYFIVSNTIDISIDAALYVEAAMVVFEGGIPYVDFVDINPPLAMYLHVPVIALAEAIGVKGITAFHLLLVAAILVSTGLSYYLLTVGQFCNRWGALIIALVPAFVSIDFANEYQYGQRPHLFLLAVMPYILLRQQRYAGKPVALSIAVVVGICMAATVSLKPPQFGIIIIIIELLLLTLYRSPTALVRTETVIPAVFVLLYASTLAWPPNASFDIYVERYIPLILEIYNSYNPGMPALLAAAQDHLLPNIIISAVCAGIVWKTGTPALRALALTSLALALGGAVAFLAQGKGWKYHGSATEFAAALSGAILLASLIEKRFSVQQRSRVCWGELLTTLSVASLLIAYMLHIMARESQHTLQTELVEIVSEYSGPGDRIAFLGIGAQPIYPMLLHLDRRLGTRYPFSIMLPLLYREAEAEKNRAYGLKPPERLMETEQWYFGQLQADISGNKPTLIVLNNRAECGEREAYCLQGLSMNDYIQGNIEELPVLSRYAKRLSTESYTALVLLESN